MLFNLLCFMIIMAFLFLTLSHPLAMGVVLLLQTLITTLMTGLMTSTYWFSYILFLVFLGGMLVLFIYVTSLASNEMFKMSFTSNLIAMTMMILPPSLMVLDRYSSGYVLNMLNMTDSSYLVLSSSLDKIYSYPTAVFTLTLILYLLLTLVVIVNITSVHAGPLRPMN